VAAPAPSILVTTDWLAENLGATDLVVLDVRGKVLPAGTPGPRYQPKRAEYETAHIPGASFVDWTRDIVDESDPVPAQVGAPETLARLFGGLGISNGNRVVAYDDYNHAFAGRLAWVLRYVGHDAVHILDGGFAKWVREGRSTTSDVPKPMPKTFVPNPRPALRRDRDAILDVVKRGSQGTLLIDARPAAQFEGKVSAASRSGHVPGAKNVPYAELVDATTGEFLPADRLRGVFTSHGIDTESLPSEIVTYCNGGVTATVVQNALRILGRDDVAVYDGSWNEWGNDPALPIVSGD